jgi:hypothetical protein
MTTFTFYIRDDRHDIPITQFVIVKDAERARSMAAKHLLESTHHTAIDVYEGAHLRFSMTPGAAARSIH